MLTHKLKLRSVGTNSDITIIIGALDFGVLLFKNSNIQHLVHTTF